jgi:hypothetical protein
VSANHVASLLIASLSLLLALAAAAKLRRPAVLTAAIRATGLPRPAWVTRLIAIAELLVAGAGLGLSGSTGGLLVGVAFAGLAIAAAVMALRGGGSGCGCFGDRESRPLGRRHAATSAVLALSAAVASSADPSSLISVLRGDRPGVAAASLAGDLLAALALRAWLTGVTPQLGSRAVSLVDTSARIIEGRLSRRSALARLALAGSALATAPLRYLLYPGSALAVVVPSRCADGLCTDGYTAFCCEINQGVNGCPEGTFVGGWWMCTDYRGHQLCENTGRRYYIDCNALPHHPFPGGCRCANDSCEQRRVACNAFRYGQCNTHIKGTTAVVCRVVTCENPGHIPELGCSRAVMVDDAVCGHEAGCLEPAPVQLPGVGGA